MAGLLNIGLTGLNAAQIQLNTTSHNIANAGTPGYNRQAVIQSTNDPLFSGVGFFGQGTRISGVTRQYSQFLENQVLAADNRRSEFSTYSAQIGQINNLLSDPSSGLSPAMQSFFAGVQEVAANPTNVAARQALISNAQSLVSTFQGIDNRLGEIRQGVESEIKASVDLINNYGERIAEMNQRILIAQSAGVAVPANDLLDQRNLLVADLNQLIKVTTVPANDGSLNVFIGSGQTLVLGQQVSRLGIVPDANDPTRNAVALISPNGNTVALPEKLLTGGQLGGLLTFRRDSLDPTQNQLGLIAVALTETFNAQHRLGQDLNGNLGNDFFKSAPISTRPTSADLVRIDVTAIGQLTASDYKLERSGTNYILTELASGRIWDLAKNLPLNNFSATLRGSIGGGIPGDTDGVTVAGLRISPDELAVGVSSVLIQPTRFAARDISVAIADVRNIAAGEGVTAPVSNAGSGRITDIRLDSVAVMPPSANDRFFPSFTLNYDAATNTLEGLDIRDTAAIPAQAPGYYLVANAFDPATESIGKSFQVVYANGTDSNAFTFQVSGTPQDGDQFVFAANDKGVADNRNATLLGALQTARVLFSAGGEPTASLQSGYAQLVSQVGNKTREVQVGEQAQNTLLRQARDTRDSLSGVNLDEEAANLIRYQQAYQASGRVMAIAQRLFDELLSIAR